MTWSTVSVTLSFLVGISLTRLLTGLVAVFRARVRAELDWIPVAWSAVMILTLLEAWIAVNSLVPLIPAFTYGHYFSLAGLLLLLFAAAALLLPPGELVAGESLKIYFIEEGRFALPLLSLYAVAAMVANLTLFDSWSLTVSWWALDLAMIVLPVLTFALSHRRRMLEGITVLYLLLFAVELRVALSLPTTDA